MTVQHVRDCTFVCEVPGNQPVVHMYPCDNTGEVMILCADGRRFILPVRAGAVPREVFLAPELMGTA